MVQPPFVAYFSMEIGLESGMPTYSGGLGVLAGDKIRSAADLEVPKVAVTLAATARVLFFSGCWQRSTVPLSGAPSFCLRKR
jgi:hypothetical protein